MISSYLDLEIEYEHYKQSTRHKIVIIFRRMVVTCLNDRGKVIHNVTEQHRAVYALDIQL